MSESKAKRAKVLDLLDGYSSLIGKELTGLTNALCVVADRYSGDVVMEACIRLALTCKFPPTPADMSEACEAFNDMLHPKIITLYNGMIDMDFGHGRIDMQGLTEPEQDQIIRQHGLTHDKRNFALLSLAEKKAALHALPAPAPKKLRYTAGDNEGNDQ